MQPIGSAGTDHVEPTARVYDRYWGPYPRTIAGQVLALHDALAPDAQRRVLDLVAGAGLVVERVGTPDDVPTSVEDPEHPARVVVTARRPG